MVEMGMHLSGAPDVLSPVIPYRQAKDNDINGMGNTAKFERSRREWRKRREDVDVIGTQNVSSLLWRDPMKEKVTFTLENEIGISAGRMI